MGQILLYAQKRLESQELIDDPESKKKRRVFGFYLFAPYLHFTLKMQIYNPKLATLNNSELMTE